MDSEHDSVQNTSVTIELSIGVRVAGTGMTVSSDFGSLSREIDPDMTMEEMADEIGAQILFEYLGKSELMPGQTIGGKSAGQLKSR